MGEHGVDRHRVFGIGHSNGAMMTLRLMCETDLFAAGVSVSGALLVDANRCTQSKGKRILALHGSLDENVPVAGGKGTRGLSNAVFTSEASSRQAFTDSGTSYELDLVDGADHSLDHIDQALEKAEGKSVAKKAAEFFRLLKP